MFRALIERVPMVTYVCDADNRITYISPQIEEWTGLPVHKWTDDPTFWHTLIHPDDRDRVVGAEFGSGFVDIEYRVRGRDGAWIWLWEQEVQLPAGGTQGIALDITALRHAQDALQATQDRLAATVNAAPVILFATDPEGIITLSEGKGLELLGHRPGAVVGRSIFDVYPELPEVQVGARRALAGESFENQIGIGEMRFDCSWSGMPDGSLIGIAIDVTARHRSEERLAHLAFHDPLTGLPNRRTLEEQLEREIARARREHVSLAALYIDVDHFKLVNDSLGHAAGDDVLVQLAERIRGVTRAGDLLARLGGDEFMLICAGTGTEGAEAAAAKILAALDPTFLVGGVEFKLGASIGIAVGPADGDTASDLVQHADAAMYQAKREGRDACAVYHDEAQDSRARLTLTARLRRALADAEFVLHYQPVYDLASRAVFGVEALVRWQDPESGLVPPDRFIPHAETTGLITQIGGWVLEEVCRQAAVWNAAGLAIRVALNASPRELRDEGYADDVAAALRRHDLNPAQLLIEVRESAMDDSGRAHESIERLHRLGVKLGLDDFGADHSSLSRLRALPVQVLKVDRSFMRDLPGDEPSAAIVRAIATLGAGLDMDVVVEGIETEEQLQFAADVGCRFGQGFHYSRPLPVEQITQLLATSPRAQPPRAAPATARSRAALPRSPRSGTTRAAPAPRRRPGSRDRTR
jgi:diguanylate cyclase (GGDEF)-like protein/PAS domain S-box-containing protein